MNSQGFKNVKVPNKKIGEMVFSVKNNNLLKISNLLWKLNFFGFIGRVSFFKIYSPHTVLN